MMIHIVYILFLTCFLRWWRIDDVPFLQHSSLLFFRYVSVLASCFSVFFLCRIGVMMRSRRVGLLSAWCFAIAPWALEQGRMVSPSVIGLPIFLILFLWYIQTKRTFVLWLIHLYLFPFFLFLWWWQSDLGIASLRAVPLHMVSLFSFEMIFFQNSSFWWGGVREFGMLYMTWILPFFLGVYSILPKHMLMMWIMGIIGLIYSSAPMFPEGRQGFFLLPFFCLFVGCGIASFSLYVKRNYSMFVLFLFLLFMMYEIMQFLHYYFIHFPQDVRGHMQDISVLF